MKRISLLILLVLAISGLSVAQADISGLGADFENLVEELGKEMLPNIEQLAVWGQYPGQAAMPDDSRFFFTMSLGAVLGFNGILNFIDDPDAFELLNVGALLDTILEGGGAANTIANLQGFFPYPIARTAVGFKLPADLEVMADVAIMPQFLANFAVNTANRFVDSPIPTFTLNSLHVGSRIRKVVLRDAPGIPAISIGAGYSYTGFNIGYSFADIGAITTALGDLYFAGDFYLQNRVHSFGLDLHISKSLGWFVPFIGLSPYFQLAGFSGGVSEFDAFVDFFPGEPINRDIEYDGLPPETTLVDYDLALVLFGGFDFVFDSLALQVHTSYTVGEGWPAVTIGTRFQ